MAKKAAFTDEEVLRWILQNARRKPPSVDTVRAKFRMSDRRFLPLHQEARRILAARDAAEAAGEEPAPLPAALGARKFRLDDPAYRGPTIHILRTKGLSLAGLEEFLGVGQDDARAMLESLREAGYAVSKDAGVYRVGKVRSDTVPKVLSFKRLDGAERRFGVLSDTHVCNAHQRLDVVAMAYEEFKRQKVEVVLHAGNLLDGYSEAINGGEVLFRNVDDQIAYLADHYPQATGIKTHFLTAECHEGWWAKAGLNIGQYMESELGRHGRTDLCYAGHVEADIALVAKRGRALMRLFHPGGGTAYAQSYQPQKIVESYQGGEKPSVLLVGHYHKLGDFYPREVWVAMLGCCEDQTRWMRTKHIAAHVGFGVVRIRQDEKGGISRFVFEQTPFYDRTYHAGERDVWIKSAAEILGI